MPAKVMLKVIKGTLTGEEFVFDERTTCIVGRGKDCSPRIPDDKEHRTISRHHCLLDINPPDIRIRDFGSLNGTLVNGKKIGQRAPDQTPEEAASWKFPEHDLKANDEVKLGATVFRVGIAVPKVCARCNAEISEEGIAVSETALGVYECAACRQVLPPTQPGVPPTMTKAFTRPGRVCTQCGRDIDTEIGSNRHGELVCAACQEDPWQIMNHLLEQATSGDKNLLAVQGYTILRELGQGGMGAVYLAEHNATGAQVALKVMLPKVAVDARSRELFLRETENTKALKHPNVVQLLESGCSGGTFFFTMEYCDGGSVDTLLAKHGGKLPLAEASEIILQALLGLDYAHQAEIPYAKLAPGQVGPGRGLVHRDLKPHNLFLTGTGSNRLVKIGDYGLAKAFDSAGLSGQTRTGELAGTPLLMPRQQVISFKYAKPEVDVWAMAACFYYMLTGHTPREFPHGKDPWLIVLQTKAVPIRERDPVIPERVAAVLDQALIDDPAIPFPTAAALRQALVDVL